MPKTKLIISTPLPNKEEFIKAMKEASLLEVKQGLGNQVYIDHSVISCTMDLGDKEINISTEKKAISKKALIKKVIKSLTTAILFFITLNTVYEVQAKMTFVFAIILGYIVFVTPLKIEADPDKFHSIVINYLKETYGAKEEKSK